MRELYKILAELEKRKIPYCFQCQGNFYNLSVTDPRGKQHTCNSKNIEDIEMFITTMWGHIRTVYVAPAVSGQINTIYVTPKPSGLPRPF